MNGKTAKMIRKVTPDVGTQKLLKRTWAKRGQAAKAEIRENAARAAKEQAEAASARLHYMREALADYEAEFGAITEEERAAIRKEQP